MFKRKPRSYQQLASDMVYPRGGWGRALQYLGYRLRRLPDQPQRIGRGVAAGVFVSFTPLFGLHLVAGMALAWALRGNLLASVIGTLAGNPVTFPFIALLCVGIGRWVLGIDGALSGARILESFTGAGAELVRNIGSIARPGVSPEWGRLLAFWHDIFLPYTVGSLLPGLVAAVVSHYATVAIVRGHHKRRAAKMAARIESRARKAAAKEARRRG